MPTSEEIRYYLAVLVRRRGLLLAGVSATLLIVTVFNLATGPLYKAAALVQANPIKPVVLPGRDPLQPELEVYSAVHRLLAMEGMAEVVVQRLDLEKEPEFQGEPLWERIRTGLGLADPTPDPQRARRHATAIFQSRISVEAVPQSFLIAIQFTSGKAETAAKAANMLAELYVSGVLESRNSRSVRVGDWLAERLQEQRKTTEDASRALLDFGTGPLSHDQRELLVSQRLGALTSSIARAHADRITKESRYNMIRQLPLAELAMAPFVADAAVQTARSRLVELRQEQQGHADTLGDKHPEMVRLRAQIREGEKDLADAAGSVRRSANQDYRLAVQEENALEAALGALQVQAREQKRAGLAYDAMEREAKADQDLYQSLVNRAKDSGIEAELKLDVRIEQRAVVPSAPFYPNKSRNYLRGGLIGLFLSLCLIFLVERFDQNLRTPEDVKEHLRLPLIGLVPVVASKTTRGADGANGADHPRGC